MSKKIEKFPERPLTKNEIITRFTLSQHRKELDSLSNIFVKIRYDEIPQSDLLKSENNTQPSMQTFQEEEKGEPSDQIQGQGDALRQNESASQVLQRPFYYVLSLQQAINLIGEHKIVPLIISLVKSLTLDNLEKIDRLFEVLQRYLTREVNSCLRFGNQRLADQIIQLNDSLTICYNGMQSPELQQMSEFQQEYSVFHASLFRAVIQLALSKSQGIAFVQSKEFYAQLFSKLIASAFQGQGQILLKLLTTKEGVEEFFRFAQIKVQIQSKKDASAAPLNLPVSNVYTGCLFAKICGEDHFLQDLLFPEVRKVPNWPIRQWKVSTKLQEMLKVEPRVHGNLLYKILLSKESIDKTIDQARDVLTEVAIFKGVNCVYLYVEGPTQFLHEVHQAMQVILFERAEQGFETSLIGTFATPQVWSMGKENPLVVSAKQAVEKERMLQGLSQEEPYGSQMQFTILRPGMTYSWQGLVDQGHLLNSVDKDSIEDYEQKLSETLRGIKALCKEELEKEELVKSGRLSRGSSSNQGNDDRERPQSRLSNHSTGAFEPQVIISGGTAHLLQVEEKIHVGSGYGEQIVTCSKVLSTPANVVLLSSSDQSPGEHGSSEKQISQASSARLASGSNEEDSSAPFINETELKKRNRATESEEDYEEEEHPQKKSQKRQKK